MRRCITVLFLALALMLGACSSPAPSQQEGPVTLRLTWWGNDLRNRLTREAIDLFMQQNPDIKVELEPGEWNSYWDRLATQAAGRDMPDVLAMDESQISAYSERGVLLDLETQSGTLDLSGLDAPVLDTGRVGDTLTGAPVGVGIFSVAVNPDVLAAAGVEMPDDKTWTWDDLTRIAAQVTQNTPEGTYGLDHFGLATAELGYFARQNGEEIFPREGEKPLTTATVQKFLDRVAALESAGAVPPYSVQNEDNLLPVDTGMFGSGKSAFHFLFHTQVQAFASASGSEMQLLRLPSVTAGEPHMANKASMYWSISSQSQHPEEAAKLVDFLMTDLDAAKILLVERGVPAIPDVQEAVEPLLEPTGKVALNFARDMQAEVVTPPKVTPSSAVSFSNEFVRLVQSVMYGQADAASVSQQIVDLAGNSNT